MLSQPQLNIKWNTFSESQKAFTLRKGLKWRWHRIDIFLILSEGTIIICPEMQSKFITLVTCPPLLLISHHSPPAFIVNVGFSDNITTMVQPRASHRWCSPIGFIIIIECHVRWLEIQFGWKFELLNYQNYQNAGIFS